MSYTVSIWHCHHLYVIWCSGRWMLGHRLLFIHVFGVEGWGCGWMLTPKGQHSALGLGGKGFWLWGQGLGSRDAAGGSFLKSVRPWTVTNETVQKYTSPLVQTSRAGFLTWAISLKRTHSTEMSSHGDKWNGHTVPYCRSASSVQLCP